MRKRILKVHTNLYQQIPKHKRLLPKTFYRKTVYEAARIIDLNMGLGERLLQIAKPGGASLCFPDSFAVDLTVTGDEAIRRLNREFRDTDAPTDVLSFPAWEGSGALSFYPGSPVHLGDIVISADTAARQAEEEGIGLSHMTAWLIAHSMLHLLGFDHITEAERSIMYGYELKILKAIGFGSLPGMAVKAYKE